VGVSSPRPGSELPETQRENSKFISCFSSGIDLKFQKISLLFEKFFVKYFGSAKV
jgi:hypothetical protein